MGSQVSQRQKRDLAKYYTSLLGSKEQNSVNAYMQVGQNEQQNSGQGKRKRKIKRKPRAHSQANNTSKLQGTDSTKNLLTIENDMQEGRTNNVNEYGLDNGEDPENEILAEQRDTPVELSQMDSQKQNREPSMALETQSDKPNEGK